MFAKLAAIYGAKFADQWASLDRDNVVAVWSAALQQLTRAEIRDGFQRLIASGKAFPPTLPEFFAACRPPIAIPSVTDHRGLEELAARLGVRYGDCGSYADLRARIQRAAENRSTLPQLESRQ